jgi:uncharacterized phiE125 gp8 family phage protein
MWPIPYPGRRDPDLQWTRTVEPTQPPISMQDARDQLRVTQPDGANRIQRYIDAATGAAEEYLGRGLLTQTWQLTLSTWYDVIWLPMAAPLQSVTSVKYYDANGVLQTLATSYYTVETVSRPGRIVRAALQSFPGIQSGRIGGCVVITYVVGWTSPDLIPERIKQGCRLYVGLCDADADGTDPNHERALQAASYCWSDRVSVIWPDFSRPPYTSLWPV